MRYRSLAICTVLAVIVAAGCAGEHAGAGASAPPKPEVRFIDLQSFDRDLERSLGAKLQSVDVTFFDRVTPSVMPERLQRWLAAVDEGGGTVTVVPAERTRGLSLVVGAISAVWSASSKVKELASERQFTPARSYDAKILLKVDEGGNTVVEKVVFIQRGE